MPCPSQSSRFNHPDYIRWTVQNMKFLIVEPSQFPILIPPEKFWCTLLAWFILNGCIAVSILGGGDIFGHVSERWESWTMQNFLINNTNRIWLTQNIPINFEFILLLPPKIRQCLQFRPATSTQISFSDLNIVHSLIVYFLAFYQRRDIVISDYASTRISMSTFLIRSTTSQSDSYPTVLMRHAGTCSRPNQH